MKFHVIFIICLLLIVSMIEAIVETEPGSLLIDINSDVFKTEIPLIYSRSEVCSVFRTYECITTTN